MSPNVASTAASSVVDNFLALKDFPFNEAILSVLDKACSISNQPELKLGVAWLVKVPVTQDRHSGPRPPCFGADLSYHLEYELRSKLGAVWRQAVKQLAWDDTSVAEMLIDFTVRSEFELARRLFVATEELEMSSPNIGEKLISVFRRVHDRRHEGVARLKGFLEVHPDFNPGPIFIARGWGRPAEKADFRHFVSKLQQLPRITGDDTRALRQALEPNDNLPHSSGKLDVVVDKNAQSPHLNDSAYLQARELIASFCPAYLNDRDPDPTFAGEILIPDFMFRVLDRSALDSRILFGRDYAALQRANSNRIDRGIKWYMSNTWPEAVKTVKRMWPDAPLDPATKKALQEGAERALKLARSVAIDFIREGPRLADRADLCDKELQKKLQLEIDRMAGGPCPEDSAKEIWERVVHGEEPLENLVIPGDWALPRAGRDC